MVRYLTDPPPPPLQVADLAVNRSFVHSTSWLTLKSKFGRRHRIDNYTFDTFISYCVSRNHSLGVAAITTEKLMAVDSLQKQARHNFQLVRGIPYTSWPDLFRPSTWIPGTSPRLSG